MRLLVSQPRNCYHADETGLPQDTFPRECPFSVAQVLDEDFLPEL